MKTAKFLPAMNALCWQGRTALGFIAFMALLLAGCQSAPDKPVGQPTASVPILGLLKFSDS